jgi:glycosyltransferase involved in cell wall biosynthesis
MSKTIKVAVDTRDLKKGKTGTHTYLDSFCTEFKKINLQEDAKVQYFFITYYLPVYNGKNNIGKIVEHLLFTLWKQFFIPIYCILYQVDILFCTDYFLPIMPLRTKKVVVFHDTFFFEQPNHYNLFWLKTFHLFAVKAAKNAAQIIVPTKFVAHKVATFIPEVINKITVVYEGPKYFDSILNQPSHNHLSNSKINQIEKWLQGQKYILHVGTLDYRKNLLRLIKAYQLIQNKHTIKLILVGSSPAYKTSNGTQELETYINEQLIQNQVLLLGRVEVNLLGHLYQNAFQYVFPSLNEGFGLPLLEAMQYQLPIAAANNTALPEVAEKAAIYFDPTNVEEIAQKMALLIEDEAIRTELKRQASERLLCFNWEKSAAQLNKLFESIVAQRQKN